MQKPILKLLAITLLIAFAIGALVSVIGWVLGWNTPTQFSNGLFIAGAILIALGVLGVMGGYKMRSDFGVIYSQSAGDMNISERTQRWVSDTAQSYGTTAFLTLTGAFLMGLAVLIGSMS